MEEIKPTVFRAYDVRGFYPNEINQNTAFVIGKALAVFLQKKYKKESLTIVVGRDGRNSSLELSLAVKEGLLLAGVNIIDIGLVPAPVFYFSVWNNKFDGGVFITASHNPGQYNGFKLVGRDAVLIAANTGIVEVKDLAIKINAESQPTKTSSQKVEVIEKDYLADYERFVFKNFSLQNFKPLKIAVDCGNGAMGVFVSKIIKKIPGEHQLIFCDIDGNFPNHLPDPSQKSNLEKLSQKVIEAKCDLGVAFDGDGDRVGFVDERGEMISPNLITAFLVGYLAKKNKEKKFVYTVCMSNVIKDIVREVGGSLFMAKVGFTFVKELAKQQKAAIGAEISGHYCLKSDWFCEGPIFVWLSVLEEISKTSKKTSDIFESFNRYFYEGPLNYEVKDKEKAISLLESHFKNGKVSKLDGVRVDFSDWWFNVRPSNTENLLRVVIEAETKQVLDEKKKEILEIFQGI